MDEVFGLKADVELGSEKLPDWRKADAESDPDDEELDETPADVIAILGFDPKTEFAKSRESKIVERIVGSQGGS